MADRFPHRVNTDKTIETEDGIPQMFIEHIQQASVSTRAWLAERGLVAGEDYDIEFETYYRGDDPGTKIIYKFADPDIAMVFKLTFAGV